MDIAALIISVIALLCAAGCLVIMLAKNYFSTHVVQMVDPMKTMMENLNPEMGASMTDPFRELGDPISQEELEHLENLKKRRQAK